MGAISQKRGGLQERKREKLARRRSQTLTLQDGRRLPEGEDRCGSERGSFSRERRLRRQCRENTKVRYRRGAFNSLEEETYGGRGKKEQ